MDLVKENWTEKDGVSFNEYLESLKNLEKIDWARKILNSKMELLAIKTPVMKEIVKKISEGNYLSFLDLELNNYYENMAINGLLIPKIDDFDIMKKYLDKYVLKIENWASCDILSFNIKKREEKYYNLSLEYIKSDKPFVRRVGLLILFKLIENDQYIDKIYNVMNQFYNEEHYYVNMINAWLFCECFIKRREKTLEFLKTHKLNKFTINKGISKCRDSFRVSVSDKEMLISYRRK